MGITKTQLTNTVSQLKEYVDNKSVNISSETGNSIETKEDGIYVAEVGISEKENNALSKEADGLYVPVQETTISAEDNNAIVKKEDGLFVENKTADIETLTEKYDTIKKYQKYLNVDMDSCYCQLSKDYNPVAGEYLPFIKKSGSMAVQNGRVIVKPGQRVQIDIAIGYGGSTTTYANIVYSVMDYTNNINIGVISPIISTNYEIPDNTMCQYTNDTNTDCEIGVKVDLIRTTDTLFYSRTIMTVHEIGRQTIIDPIEHANEKYGIEDTPVGHIISYMGTVAPKHYLICDGTEYNIMDYPYLAQHFIDQFGSVNYFGGDGSTTFCVPDLRGEFLRGTGTATRNTGSGSSVGKHQDPTRHLFITRYSNGNIIVGSAKTVEAINSERVFHSTDGKRFDNGQGQFANANHGTHYTSRPTNTSVLYCIKYAPTYYIKNYSAKFNETTLWEGSAIVDCSTDGVITSNLTFNLVDNINNYDRIEIRYSGYRQSDGAEAFHTFKTFIPSELMMDDSFTGDVCMELQFSYHFAIGGHFTDEQTLYLSNTFVENTSLTSLDALKIYQIVGLKSVPFDNNEISDGKSAYEIALDNGFEGTEQEWLESLKGENGTDGKSISSIIKDDSDNIIVTFTDGTTQNIGTLSVDIQGNFLTENGFGNLRYYNGNFQYYNTKTSTWIDTTVSPENTYVINMMPQEIQFIKGIYNIEQGHYQLKWKEPTDTIIDGQVACVVEKVVIRRKLGSVPTDEHDGDLVLEVPRKDFGQYTKIWYIDESFTPNLDEVWYYKAFPISTTGFANGSQTNEISILCKDYYLFGFRIDQTESDPASMISYIEDNANYSSAYMNYTTDTFDYGDWTTDSGAWFMDVKPCMLNYDGTVSYYLNPNDYALKVDGTTSNIADDTFGGNAMIQFPKVYWKIVDNGDNTADIYISNKQLDEDFHCWSHIDNNGNEIDYCYMPIYNGSNVSSVLRSISGKAPMAYQTVSTEITYAKANNQTEDMIWNTEVFSDRMLVNLLLLLIGKSTNTQVVFGTGNNNTYVSTSNTGIKNTGTLNTKGLFWGNQDNASCVKVFGMENWWGNIWRRIAGWINDKGTQKIKLTYGQSDGSTIDGYNLDGSGYIAPSNCTPSGTSGGYINKMSLSKYGLIPTTASGSATTYFTDGLWFNNAQVDYALVGGSSSCGLLVGALCSTLHNAVSRVDWSVGAALSCKPLA